MIFLGQQKKTSQCHHQYWCNSYISFFCRRIHSFNSVFVSVATLNIYKECITKTRVFHLELVPLGTFPLYKKVLLDLIMSPHSLQPPLLSCLFVFKLGSAKDNNQCCKFVSAVN